MLIAIISLTVMGLALGLMLGLSSKLLRVEEDPIEGQLQALLPGSQCGQCGYVGCSQYAAALAHDGAPVTQCTPGGRSVAEALAKALGVSLDLSQADDIGPKTALIHEDLCIGCTACIRDCSSDAIIGAARQVHTIIPDVCHGCSKCETACPTGAIEMVPVAVTLDNWHWDKPNLAIQDSLANPAFAAQALANRITDESDGGQGKAYKASLEKEAEEESLG
ncbi:RnfABCDGE type electron transport complex subunit B [Zymomonas sp.]|uniref:RnfABCDGE type electron transport complex subunit B n=1 Tax=Zymomonas sp. TaxID=2068624 RepID=UPI0025F61D1F|nr:RnfABCDGE type electron transport complex subunit B [Zymomonas sp.]MCA1955798.1 RnfABCDGE type electron transport complex subunit B [Zymomonas sp.]